MNKFYFGVSILFGILSVSGQETKTLWQKNIQSSTQDFLVNVAATLDGQFLIAGSSIKDNSGYDYHIIKLSQQGTKLWEKYLRGNLHDYLGSALALKDGSFMLNGSSYSSIGIDKKEKNFGSSDIWIVKLDENGNELWQKSFGTSLNEEAKASVEGNDGSIVIAGNVQQNNYGFGSKDVWLIKLDANGNKITEAYLGGKNIDEVEKIIATRDGGYLVAMNSRSGKSHKKDFIFFDKNEVPILINKELDNYGENDYWIVKLDKNLNQQWQKNYGGSEDDKVKNLALTDSGYIIGGESRSHISENKKAKQEEGTDLWLISLSEGGDENWQKSFSFKNRDVLMSMNIINHNDGESLRTKGILIGGYTQAESKRQKNDETFWMLYLDNKGEEIWRKYVEGKEKNQEERLVSANLNRDGTFLIAGTSTEEFGQENWKIVKLGDKQVEDLIESQQFSIYPNPVEDYCYVEIGVNFDSAMIQLYDMSGKLLQNVSTMNRVTKINTRDLVQGAYLLSGITNTNKKLTAKIIKK